VRIAFLFPRFKILSGAERLILKLAGAVAAQGHEVHVLSHQFDPSCQPLVSDKVIVSVSGVPLNYFHNRYANAAFDYFRSGRLLKLLPPETDVICCFGPAVTAVPALRRKTRAPLLYFCYEPPRFLYTDRQLISRRLGFTGFAATQVFRMYRRKDRKLVGLADLVLSNSEFGRRQIREVYGCDSRLITHGLDPYLKSTRRDELRQKCGFRRSDIAVLTVNYLHPRKRIELFIEAVKLAHSQNPSIRGLIVGDGPERETLRQLGGDLCCFSGFVPENELFEYYQSADVYLHAGRLETFGLSVIEASGNRLPVVSVNEGGPLETVNDGITGFLREPTSEDLAGALLALAVDGKIRSEMGARGFEYVRNKYSWEKGAQDFLQAVDEIQRKDTRKSRIP
jgi:alpha-1,3/alpha-1,6-mannosyltransferase